VFEKLSVTNSKRICFHVFSYPLGISESIIESARGFAENGFHVDIFVDECSYDRSPISFSEDNVNIIRIVLEHVTDVDLTALFADHLDDFEEFLNVNKLFPRYPYFLKNMILKAQDHRYDLMIGVEAFGLVSATLLGHLKSTPVIYFNLELHKKSHCQYEEEYLLKKLEIQASRKCWLVIVPDAKRGAVLRAENQIRESCIRFLPVSTKGEQVKEENDYFRRKFDISNKERVLIYAGNFADWALCRELVASSNAWPDDYVLIMHTWQKDVEQTRYLKDLKKVGIRNVFFSTEPIQRDIFPMALSSADAGLMFYNQADENNTETGSSSNKLTQYFKAGLPVIASDCVSIKEIFDYYRCGKCVSSPFEIKRILDRFFHNLDRYRYGVSRAYNDHYNFDVHFSPLLGEINSMLF